MLYSAFISTVLFYLGVTITTPFNARNKKITSAISLIFSVLGVIIAVFGVWKD
jgi:hypothetical protein